MLKLSYSEPRIKSQSHIKYRLFSALDWACWVRRRPSNRSAPRRSIVFPETDRYDAYQVSVIPRERRLRDIPSAVSFTQVGGFRD
jgi:hypothetical protein